MIRDFDFSPDGRFLVSCSFDGTVHTWRMRDGFSKLLEHEHAFDFCNVKFNPDGRYVTADGMLTIWNVRTSQLVAKWTAHHDGIVQSVVFTPDGKGLVSGGHETWKCWDISLLESSEPGYGMAKDRTAGQKSKAMIHTVRH